MVVQHNLTAANTNRQLGITTSGLQKSTEKLSSGYKINRAVAYRSRPDRRLPPAPWAYSGRTDET